MGTSHDLRSTSPVSISSEIVLSLFVFTNFSLSAGPPLDTPSTTVDFFSNSGAFFSNAHA